MAERQVRSSRSHQMRHSTLCAQSEPLPLRECRSGLDSSRAQIAHTCFGKSGRFCPMRQPLFQTLRFEVTARSWTLDIFCPLILTPDPNISTVLTSQYTSRSNDLCPMASTLGIAADALDWSEPFAEGPTSCSARSQHGKCGTSTIFDAAAQREYLSFAQVVENLE